MNALVYSLRNQLRSGNTDSSSLSLWELFTQKKSTSRDWWIRFSTFTLPILFLVAVIFQPWVDPKWMFLDPLTAAELSGDCCHSHFGFVSTAGVILWAATAAVSLFTASVLLTCGKRFQVAMFPLSAGMLTGWIALDDAFLLHETVLPAFGVSQNVVITIYILLALSYFSLNFTQILKHDFWLLAMGAYGLAVSVMVDVVFHSLNPTVVLLEDSAKFFGIFCWASFHITTFLALLSKHQQAEINV